MSQQKFKNTKALILRIYIYEEYKIFYLIQSYISKVVLKCAAH